MSFDQLTPEQQAQAKARFINAGVDDWYQYILDHDGNVLCRTWRSRPLFPGWEKEA